MKDNLEETSRVITPTVQQPAPEEVTYIPAPKDPDACVTQRFAADAIPYGFEYDPSCPPDIYAPPKYIPPWDPGPIIK